MISKTIIASGISLHIDRNTKWSLKPLISAPYFHYREHHLNPYASQWRGSVYFLVINSHPRIPCKGPYRDDIFSATETKYIN